MILCCINAQLTLTLVCPGTEIETEGRDRPDLDLPGYQLQILKDAVFYSK